MPRLFPPRWLRLGSEPWHPSDDDVLLYLDGEVPDRRMTRVHDHLEACWACRARAQRVQEAITEFAEFTTGPLVERMPAPPANWSTFGPMLQKEADADAALGSDRRGGRSRFFPSGWLARAAVAALVLLVMTIAGATPASAARAVRDAIRFVGSFFAEVAPARPVTDLAVKRTQSADVLLPAPPVPPAARPTETSAGRPPTPVVLSRLQLEEAEMFVRQTLHSLAADLHEDIRLSASPEGIRVTGILDTPERRKEIAQVLSGHPSVRIQLETAAEVASRSKPVTDVPPPAVSPDGTLRLPERVNPVPLLQSTLMKFYPDVHAREALVNTVLRELSRSNGRAWALRRLAERYTPTEIAALTPELRQTLVNLTRSHAAALRDAAETLKHVVEPVLETGRGSASLRPEARPTLTLDADWHAVVMSIVSSSNSVDASVRALFLGVPSDVGIDRATQAWVGAIANLNEGAARLSVIESR